MAGTTRKQRRATGFTLVELMIVVAIIGILAAVAIPNFIMFQLRAKTSEARMNIAAIRTAEEAYFAKFGVYIGGGAVAPIALPNPRSQKNPWPNAPVGFTALGWEPEGDVYYQYALTGGGAIPRYTIAASGDLDGDGVFSEFAYVHPAAGTVFATPGWWPSCASTGVYNATTGAQDLQNTIGPCGALDGRSEF